MRSWRAPLSLLVGLVALGLLWGLRFAYGDFLPLRGYQPIHAHVMAPQEGLFLGLYVVLGALACFGLGLAAFQLSRRSPVELLGRLADRLSDRSWLGLLTLLAAGASLLVGGLLLRGTFLTDDEMAMLFQARLLREGQLWAAPTPFQDVFNYAMIIEEPRWYGIYPIGHPALMALSLLLTDDPRALFALVAAGWVALTFLLARRLFERRTALLAAALLALSPFFVLTSGSLASELSSGLFLLVAANVAVRLGERARAELLYAALLGLSLGAAYLVRPYTALALGAPLAAWVAWRWFRRETAASVPLVATLCALPFVVAYLVVNADLTGSAWLTPYEVNFPGRFRIGFGQDAFGVIHTPQLALAVLGLTLFELNVWTLGWPLSLLPVGAALLLERPRGAAALLVALPLCLLVAYIPVPMAGVHDTGPLYYLEVLPLLAILAARGLILLTRRFAGRGADLVAWLALACFAVSGLVFWRQQLDVLDELVELNSAPYEVAERVIDGRALVFVEEIQTSPPSSWVLGIRPPRPDLSDRLIFCHAVPLGRAREALAWAGGRRGYFLSRDRRFGDVSLIPLPR